MELECSVYETLKFAGCRMAHHESDLYVKVDPASRRVMREMLDDKRLVNRPELFSADDGSGLWYQIPFAYDPWWAKKMELSSK